MQLVRSHYGRCTYTYNNIIAIVFKSTCSSEKDCLGSDPAYAVSGVMLFFRSRPLINWQQNTISNGVCITCTCVSYKYDFCWLPHMHYLALWYYSIHQSYFSLFRLSHWQGTGQLLILKVGYNLLLPCCHGENKDNSLRETIRGMTTQHIYLVCTSQCKQFAVTIVLPCCVSRQRGRNQNYCKATIFSHYLI